MGRPPRVPVKRLRPDSARRTLGTVVLALSVSTAASAQDGGLPDAGSWDDPIYGTCREAPPPVELDGGGWLLSPARASRNACLMATCDARRRELEQAPVLSASNPLIDLVIAVLGMAAGVYFGWQLRGIFPR